MGLALHPGFLKDQPYVFLAYVHNFKGCEQGIGGCFFTARIVRYRYDSKADILVEPEIMCDTIPAGNDHNGGRLLIAPVNGKDYLFYSIGDMGAGQFKNVGRTNKAQDVNSYEGKILRFNTGPDNDSNKNDRWLPNDNPFSKQIQSAVWSTGHRNPQGLAYASGKIYSCEHGPFSDDEVNIVEKGMNYGHPLIIGYNDGNYNGLAAGVSRYTELPGPWHTTYPTIVNERANSTAIGASYRNPIKSFYPTPLNTLQSILNQTKEGSRPDWISEAPSSIEVYTSTAIPGWQNSLLISTLKTGKLIRVQLNTTGDAIAGDTITYFKDVARYRDIALSADGTKIYLSIDSSAVTSGPTEGKRKASDCRGCIVEFSYQPANKQAMTNKDKGGDIVKREE